MNALSMPLQLFNQILFTGLRSLWYQAGYQCIRKYETESKHTKKICNVNIVKQYNILSGHFRRCWLLTVRRMADSNYVHVILILDYILKAQESVIL